MKQLGQQQEQQQQQQEQEQEQQLNLNSTVKRIKRPPSASTAFAFCGPQFGPRNPTESQCRPQPVRLPFESAQPMP
ncbi:hypothetical protein AWZ03_011308 [Drosophila navojoa]|uniref:Uncharacterized protein n=1 Tax=Drosophila navojoa TaxID=7232 RepID=A0A484B373_DRONA|nr:hypothetical protein AWZ03_011308 [Drosophila navojoa]